MDAVMTTAPRSPSASGSPAAMAPAARRSTLKVPIRFTRTTVSNGWSAAGPSFFTVRSAHPTPAHDTASRSPSTDSTAACTCASSVTSAAANAPPISAASASPRSSFRSATVTRASRAASSRAVASPTPEAPPATSAPIPFSSIAGARLPGPLVFPRPGDPFAPGHPLFPSDQLGPLYDEADLENLWDELADEVPASAYTYVFQGQAQTLDHQFVSRQLERDLERVRVAHINADWPADFAADGARGASDHAPVVSRFEFPSDDHDDDRDDDD